MTWQQQCLNKQVMQIQTSHPFLKVTMKFKQKWHLDEICDYSSNVYHLSSELILNSRHSITRRQHLITGAATVPRGNILPTKFKDSMHIDVELHPTVVAQTSKLSHPICSSLGHHLECLL